MRLWRRAVLIAAMVALATGTSAQRRVPTPQERQAAETALAGFTSPTLTRFGSEAEFRRYVEAVHALDRIRYSWTPNRGRLLLAQAQTAADVQSDASEEPLCAPEDPQCGADESVVVTGTSSVPSNPSITNNQMRGVEEGDIVKQIGHHLLVLQDGRIFVVDIRPGDRRGLALTDRINVYRNPNSDIWIDEMLVFGNRILVTGYSYAEDASELSVFRLSPDGRLSREGVFFITSDDYYSSTNYATRLIDDRLVIYTPFDLDSIVRAHFKWPIVRRWIPGEQREQALRRGRPLFDAGAIYRPVRDLADPTIHSVSVCPLGEAGGERELACRTTAFIAEDVAQWYVTRTDAFVWTGQYWNSSAQRECAPEMRLDAADSLPALVYRLPTEGSRPPTVLGARGMPIDQFSMQEFGGQFRALVRWHPSGCEEDFEAPAQLTFFDTPLDGFAPEVREAGDERYTRMPGVGSRWVANRFTDHFLVYGGLSRYRRGLPELDPDDFGSDQEEFRRYRERALAMPPAFVVPVDRPRDVRPLDIRHTVIRAERVGDDIVLTGYRDRLGLRVSLIDLDRTPRIAGSVRLDGRFESEGRSHAFNSLVEPDGSGLLGLPTVPRIRESNRAPWRSRASDLSYLAMERDGTLSGLGELEASVVYGRDEDGNPDYDCEVSCIDWYGNSRPIFTDGRVFALTGTELVEGVVSAGRIRELRRLNLTVRPPPRG